MEKTKLSELVQTVNSALEQTMDYDGRKFGDYNSGEFSLSSDIIESALMNFYSKKCPEDAFAVKNSIEGDHNHLQILSLESFWCPRELNGDNWGLPEFGKYKKGLLSSLDVIHQFRHEDYKMWLVRKGELDLSEINLSESPYIDSEGNIDLSGFTWTFQDAHKAIYDCVMESSQKKRWIAPRKYSIDYGNHYGSNTWYRVKQSIALETIAEKTGEKLDEEYGSVAILNLGYETSLSFIEINAEKIEEICANSERMSDMKNAGWHFWKINELYSSAYVFSKLLGLTDETVDKQVEAFYTNGKNEFYARQQRIIKSVAQDFELGS